MQKQVEQLFALVLMARTATKPVVNESRNTIVDLVLPTAVAESLEELVGDAPQELKRDIARILGIALMRGVEKMAD